MFISKFNRWLDGIDPYALQRIMLYKCLLIATVGVYVYWLFQPQSFLAFFSPFFLIALYEAPALSTFKEKERVLIFIAVAIILISVSFYLIYPFRVFFFFFSVFVLTATYFYVLKYFYALKNLTMLLIATGAVVLSTEPSANLEVAYGFISSTALSSTMTLICLKFFPNLYLIPWSKALQKFIQCLEKDIDCAITQSKDNPTGIGTEIIHLGMVRNYRSLVPKKYMMPTYRISVNLRNIQHALDNVYYETKNELFWYGIKNNIHTLRVHMNSYSPCGEPKMSLEPKTQLQHYVTRCLHQTFIHWNRLCSLHQN